MFVYQANEDLWGKILSSLQPYSTTGIYLKAKQLKTPLNRILINTDVRKVMLEPINYMSHTYILVYIKNNSTKMVPLFYTT